MVGSQRGNGHETSTTKQCSMSEVLPVCTQLSNKNKYEKCLSGSAVVLSLRSFLSRQWMKVNYFNFAM